MNQNENVAVLLLALTCLTGLLGIAFTLINGELLATAVCAIVSLVAVSMILQVGRHAEMRERMWPPKGDGRDLGELELLDGVVRDIHGGRDAA